MPLHETTPEVWEDTPSAPELEFHDDCHGVLRRDADGTRYCDACGETL